MNRLHVSKSFGFTIGLIHRDSPESPLYNSSLTDSERLKNSLQRSVYRGKVRWEDYSSQSPSAEIVVEQLEYLIKFSHGTPPVESLALLNTGGNFIWVQCLPCKRCYEQKLPIFDPRKSSTYKPLHFLSKMCRSTKGSLYSIFRQSCGYKVSYVDGTSSKGEFAREVINLGSTAGQIVSFKVAMGCGYTNNVDYTFPASGIIGLGRGTQSLITQLGPSIEGKFSYCLQRDKSKSSKLNFGDNAVVLGDDVVTTPMAEKYPKSLYFLTLEGITVGNVRLNYYNPTTNLTSSFSSASKEDQEGNTIIDSGVRYTQLATDLYKQVVAAVESLVTRPKIENPEWKFDLCYSLQSGDDEISMTFHFQGADVKLKIFNIFARVSPNAICLAIREANSTNNIFGTVQQLEFLVGYDLQRNVVSFKPTTCSNE